MAILPFIPGLSASININNQPATEIPDPDPQSVTPNDEISAYQVPRTVTSYIACSANQAFSISLSVGPPIRTNIKGVKRMKYTKLGFEIEIDGIKVDYKGKCARTFFNQHPETKEWRDVVKGVKIGKGKSCFLMGFKFLTVKTTSENVERAEVERMRQRMQKVGTIVIKVFEENYGQKGGDAEDTTRKFMTPDQEEIHEKALKGEAKDHGTGLRGKKKVARGDFWRTEKVDGKDYPLAIFKFIYRSEEALKQLLIIERTPSPSPSVESESEVEIEDDEEELTEGLTQAQEHTIQSLMETFAKQNSRSSVSSSRGGSSARYRSKVVKKATTVKKEKQTLNMLRGLQRTQLMSKRKDGKPEPEVVDLVSDDENEDGDDEEEPPLVPRRGIRARGMFR